MIYKIMSDYHNGLLDKQAYFSTMFGVHKNLFIYPELINNTAIREISITGNGVTFNINSNGIDLLIRCSEDDAHALPMSFLNFSEYEMNETLIILRLIEPGDVVFDIGANIGWYTLNILAHRKRTVVYSFEPIESSFRLLCENLSINHFAPENAFNIGLSDENKLVTFYYDRECAMASSMQDLRGHARTELVQCEVRRLDDFILEIPTLEKLDFIKCDVEGAELLVFKGGAKAITNYKPIVFTEMLRKWSHKFGYHPNDIIQLFRSMGYDCFTIKGDHIKSFGLVDEATIETNYLFCHQEKHNQIIEQMMLD